ncbi:hypothetical protein KIPB_004271 [Kipferlia bialata]|uniref:F5/8 type C domain-containing protein n=1 Tax=Kipferlia bialata TaxID=797122 RepID=A0A9K3GI23_9EUKA|nr:hypothetical protein KIPB_004271 [Kipferlia bialata]|eukprot:g4271.t1
MGTDQPFPTEEGNADPLLPASMLTTLMKMVHNTTVQNQSLLERVGAMEVAMAYAAQQREAEAAGRRDMTSQLAAAQSTISQLEETLAQERAGREEERERLRVCVNVSGGNGQAGNDTSELALARRTLLVGYLPTSQAGPGLSTHLDASRAYSAMQARYPGIPLMEAVEERAARVDFSSHWQGYDHESEHTLTSRGFAPDTQAWSAACNVAGQYGMVTFDRPVVLVGVATRGRPTCDQWITQYGIEIFDPDTRDWVPVEEQRQYTGNTNRNSIVLHAFGAPVVAKQLRIVAVEWHQHVSMRFEVYVWRY